MNISGVGQMLAYQQATTDAAKSTQKTPSSLSKPDPVVPSAGQAFLDYMKETPMQHMEDAWLKQHGLTKQDLANMSPAQQEAIRNQMAADIKAQMEADASKKDKSTNILA